MGLKSWIFINCSKANECCDKAQYKDASAIEKMKMLMHLVFCKPCRKYTSNNRKLTSLIQESKLQRCTKEEKENWKSIIEREVKE